MIAMRNLDRMIHTLTVLGNAQRYDFVLMILTHIL